MVCAVVAGRCLAVASATRPLTLLAFPVHYQRSTTTRSLSTSSTAGASSGSTPTSSESKAPAQDPDEVHQEKKSAEMERRMQALKRFGLPKAMDEGILPQGKPVEAGEKKKKDGKEGAEQDWNAIYGDYIWYRDNQTTKGWKS